ncbi:G1 family endopeptidase [Bacillus cereus]|nr:G1 family endopeptidase [Bacillus cereus]
MSLRSTNWSGYAKYEELSGIFNLNPIPRGPFNYAYGEWIVPAIKGDVNSRVGIWVGIDGGDDIFGKPVSNYLLQIGTGADFYTSDHSPRYFGWWEYIVPQPGAISLIDKDVYNSGPLEFDSNSYPVMPGDRMAATVQIVTFTQPFTESIGVVSLWNLTRGWNCKEQLNGYNPPGRTVEFIVEAPTIVGGTADLPDYGIVTFDQCKIGEFQYAEFSGDNAIIMVKGSTDQIISIPSSPVSSTGGFEVAFVKGN